MVFLRSEEHLERWLDANGWEPGASMSGVDAERAGAPLVVDAARPRLAARGRPAESQAILDELGLTGEFWQLAERSRWTATAPTTRAMPAVSTR